MVVAPLVGAAALLGDTESWTRMPEDIQRYTVNYTLPQLSKKRESVAVPECFFPSSLNQTTFEVGWEQRGGG